MFKKRSFSAFILLSASLVFSLASFATTCPEVGDITITERAANQIKKVEESALKESIADAVYGSISKNNLRKEELEISLNKIPKVEWDKLILTANNKKNNYIIPNPPLKTLLKKIIDSLAEKPNLMNGERVDSTYSINYLAFLTKSDERLHANKKYKYTAEGGWQGYSNLHAKSLKFYTAYFHARDPKNPNAGGFLRECTYNNDKLELKLRKAEVTAFSGNWINPGNTGIIYLCDKDKKGKRDVKGCQFNLQQGS